MVKDTRIFNGRTYRLFGKPPSFASDGKPLSRIHQKNMAENAAEQIRKRKYNARVINWAGGSGIFVAPRKYNKWGRRPAAVLPEGSIVEQRVFIPDEAKIHYIHPHSKKQVQQAFNEGIQPSTMISAGDARNLNIDGDTKGTYASTVVDPNQVSEELGVIGIVNPMNTAEHITTQDGNAFITESIPSSQVVKFTHDDLKREGKRTYRVKGPDTDERGPFLFESYSLADAQTYIATMVDAVKKRGYHYTKDRRRIPAHQFFLEIDEVIN